MLLMLAYLERFDVHQLNEMVDETYRIWIEVLHERADEERKRAGGSNPMDF